MSQKRPAEGGIEDNKAKQRCFALSTDIITVTVGPQKAAYKLHESVLSQCPFFLKCLQSGMKEQHEKLINLPEDEPDSFNIIVDWLYAKILLTKAPALECDPLPNQALNAYNTADRLCLLDLQNALVDKLRVQFKGGKLRPKFVLDVYASARPECQMRKLVLDQLFYDMVTSPKIYKMGTSGTEAVKPSVASELESLMDKHQDLRRALFWKFADRAELPNFKSGFVPNPSDLTGCVYHDHEGGKKCMQSSKAVTAPVSILGSARSGAASPFAFQVKGEPTPAPWRDDQEDSD